MQNTSSAKGQKNGIYRHSREVKKKKKKKERERDSLGKEKSELCGVDKGKRKKKDILKGIRGCFICHLSEAIP